MRQLQERFAARGLAMLNFTLDDDASAWQASLNKLDLPWQQGRDLQSGRHTPCAVGLAGKAATKLPQRHTECACHIRANNRGIGDVDLGGGLCYK